MSQFHERDLPSGRHIRLPAKLSVAARGEIRSKGTRIHVEQAEGQDEPGVFTMFDPHLLALECVLQVVSHPQASLTDIDGTDMSRNRGKLAGSEELADDLDWLTQVAMELYSDQISPSSDPNAAKPPSGGKPNAKAK